MINDRVNRKVWVLFGIILLGSLFQAISFAQESESDYQQAIQKATELYNQKKYDESIKVYQQALKIKDSDATIYYNVACCYSLSNKVDEALVWLEKSITHGFTDYGHMKDDTDLDNIRNNPKFKDLVAKYSLIKELTFTIDDVDLGEQVSGPCVCPLDFQGRIVVCFHWCISCPMSTGAFPYVNNVVKKYKDRGVLMAGFQVRRYPFDVPENDCVWVLDQLKPDFPVVRLGWECEWPAKYLPWVVVFNHEGKAIFAGNIPRKGLEPLLNEALAKTPDFMVGGPYVRLKETAERIKADRQHAGKYLPAIREAAAKKDAPEEQKEALALLVCIEKYFERQVAKAEKYARGVVEKMTIYQELANQFEGDILGKKAKSLIDEMRAAKNFADEEKACIKLEEARKYIRNLPPPGRYIYDLTRMPYERSTNKSLLEKRKSMIADCQKALDSIIADYPATAAAAEAKMFRNELKNWDSDPAYDVTVDNLNEYYPPQH